MSRRVHVVIDTVVIDGHGTVDRAGFKRALTSQIARALGGASDAQLAAIASTRTLDAGRLAQPANPAALGNQIGSRLIGGRS